MRCTFTMDTEMVYSSKHIIQHGWTVREFSEQEVSRKDLSKSDDHKLPPQADKIVKYFTEVIKVRFLMHTNSEYKREFKIGRRWHI